MNWTDILNVDNNTPIYDVAWLDGTGLGGDYVLSEISGVSRETIDWSDKDPALGNTYRHRMNWDQYTWTNSSAYDGDDGYVGRYGYGIAVRDTERNTLSAITISGATYRDLGLENWVDWKPVYNPYTDISRYLTPGQIMVYADVAPQPKSFTNLDIVSAYVGSQDVSKIYQGDEQIYPTAGPADPYASMYLTAEIISGNTFYISRPDISYSVNDGPWTQTPSTATSGRPFNLTVSPGDKIRFKGNQAGAQAFQHSANGGAYYDIYGNILSLEYGDNFVGQTTFLTTRRPFYSCFRYNGPFYQNEREVRSAEHLVLPPTVVEDCYRSCFHGNHFMTVGPELPAKTPAVGCYFFMFGNCYNLTGSPVIHLESLASGSCYQMLQFCSGLTEITCLAQSGIDQDDSTTNWVQQNTGSPLGQGTFYKHQNATWPTGNNGIPNGWNIIDYQQ